jgi:hypothetical protein
MKKKGIIPATVALPAGGMSVPVGMARVLLALCGLIALSSFAATRPAPVPTAVVEAVQMPAWIERASGVRDALTIGMALANKDKVQTGAGARALLRLADGSLVKLGENGLLLLDDLAQRKINLKDVLTASLDVAAGAFRFTTQAAGRYRGERDVRAKINTITVGIRGTDVWGKNDKRWDVVCLVEGAITIMRGADAFTMDRPMTYYVAPRDGVPPPVSEIAPSRLQTWARETEIAEGAGAVRKDGRWKVYLLDFDNQADALQAYDQLRGAGYPAQIKPIKTESGFSYRVHIANLPGEKEALALAAQLKGKSGVSEPKVAH